MKTLKLRRRRCEKSGARLFAMPLHLFKLGWARSVQKALSNITQLPMHFFAYEVLGESCDAISISTWLSDQGTEKIFARYRPVPLTVLVPQPVEHGEAQIEEEDLAPPEDHLVEDIDFADNAGQPVQPQGPECVDTTYSLEVDDLVHIIHNATKNLKRAMPSYKDIVFRMRKLCDLLRKKESKEHLIEVCFGGPDGEVLARKIWSFHANVHEDRFGTVAAATPELLKVEK